MKVKARIYQTGQPNATDMDLVSLDIPGAHGDGDYIIFPGFCDVHVHLREPGFSYKETIETGSRAAARGGFTTVCPMPNLSPVPDSYEDLKQELDLIEREAVIDVVPYASCTVNEEGKQIAELEEMSSHVCAFSDDGKGIQDEEVMRKVMIEAKRLGKIVAAHCEVNDLLGGGYIHDGEYAKIHGHRGICSRSEWEEIERDVRLAKQTGASYHVCHISTKESVEIIRQAKKEGVDVTCETAPHYLVLNDSDLQESGDFKMNPPLRSKEDQEALLEAIQDGTIDMIATDHAPHSKEEKSRGLEKSAFGIVGLETAFPVLYTKLVKGGLIDMDRLIELLCMNPRKRFGLEQENSYTVWDLNAKYRIDPDSFLSKGRSTPFKGMEVYGECLMTVCHGKTVYLKEK
jgi:dihydroorotase